MGSIERLEPSPEQNHLSKRVKFSDLLKEDRLRQRFEKVRQYFFLRESTYDVTNKCNLKCKGCYYYEGEKQDKTPNRDPESWRELMVQEKDRGITFAVLAGAEPCLFPDILQACYDELPLGAIATNGVKAIPESVGYKIHISVWGNDEASKELRGYPNLLARQIENYKNDPRAVFVYTFTPGNVHDAYQVAGLLAAIGCRLTFNVFSPTIGYEGPLCHDRVSLESVRKAMLEILERYPENVLFSPYSAVVHTHRFGLHDLFSCPYPRRNQSTDIGLGRSFRQYRTDLTWDRDAACCVPDTDCDHCRHYASASAVVTSKLMRHAVKPELFKSWLDFVDSYLATWVMGYEKGENLMTETVNPPGFNDDHQKFEKDTTER